MAGLDVIISQIDTGSQQKVAQIKKTSDDECKRILDEAQAEADKQKNEAQERADSQAQDILERSRSTAKLKVRQAVLAKKQELIAESIENAKNRIYSLPVDKYFEMMLKLVTKYAGQGDGEIILSESDKKRITFDFESNISKVAAQKGGSLKLSNGTADIKGGFILKYQSIEENCSIDALFDNEYEMLVDKVQEVLFSN